MEVLKRYISQEELKTHNKREDLWISIHGKIYNVTNWVNHHPGGELPLFYFAGQEVTDPFLAYHPVSSHRNLDQYFTGYYLKDYKVSELSKDFRKMWSKFQTMGLFDKKGHGVLILLLIIAIMFYVIVYSILCTNSSWVHLACGALLGFAWIQLGWIGHDASHNQVTVDRGWNRFAQLVIGNCLSGVSTAWWKQHHNAHHIACNSLEFDPDMQLLPVFAPSSKSFTSLTSYFYERKMNFDSLSSFFIRYQHLSFFPIVAFLKTYSYFQSFWFLLSKRKVRSRGQELLGLLVFWSWYALLLSCLPNWFERIAFSVVALLVLGIQNFQFSLNHISCDVYVEPPNGNDWFEKQTLGSLNIACSPWMDWFHGGLQFQIEHHLFPRMPRCHLRTISPDVKELCKKHNLSYNCATSFWEASMLTLNAVRRVALEASNFPSQAKVLY